MTTLNYHAFRFPSTPDDTPPLSVELDALAEKLHNTALALKQQQALNAALMCEVKKLEGVNSRLMRQVRRFEDYQKGDL